VELLFLVNYIIFKYIDDWLAKCWVSSPGITHESSGSEFKLKYCDLDRRLLVLHGQYRLMPARQFIDSQRAAGNRGKGSVSLVVRYLSLPYRFTQRRSWMLVSSSVTYSGSPELLSRGRRRTIGTRQFVLHARHFVTPHLIAHGGNPPRKAKPGGWDCRGSVAPTHFKRSHRKRDRASERLRMMQPPGSAQNLMREFQ
jgi:hypothetical protein